MINKATNSSIASKLGLKINNKVNVKRRRLFNKRNIIIFVISAVIVGLTSVYMLSKNPYAFDFSEQADESTLLKLYPDFRIAKINKDFCGKFMCHAAGEPDYNEYVYLLQHKQLRNIRLEIRSRYIINGKHTYLPDINNISKNNGSSLHTEHELFNSHVSGEPYSPKFIDGLSKYLDGCTGEYLRKYSGTEDMNGLTVNVDFAMYDKVDIKSTDRININKKISEANFKGNLNRLYIIHCDGTSLVYYNLDNSWETIVDHAYDY